MNSDSPMLEYTHKELISINASLGSKVQEQAEQIESLLQSGTVLANARLELLEEIQRLKEKPTKWLCENCESNKADIRHLKDLLKSCFVEMVALQWEFHDGPQGDIYKRVEQALAAPPQKGEK